MGSPFSFVRRRSAAVSVALVASVSGGVAIAGPPDEAVPVAVPADRSVDPQPGPGPERDEPFELRGAAAVRHLDATRSTADVAANASLSAGELVEELHTDRSMFVTAEGMVGHTEPVAIASAGEAAAAPVAAPVGVDVFALSSRPGSTRVVYLDFTGHTTVGDYWNSNYAIDEIVSAPYDIDATAASFSDTERQRIADIWKLVADDYAPFDVNVTTQDPGVDGLRKTSSGDTAYGQRVVITSSDWYYASQARTIGGIALIGVFSSSTDHAAFVFSGNLGGGAVKAVGEAASHEAGHTFGLGHDGTSGTSGTGYYSGHGDWAPIMGVGYYKTITQWSKGEYTNASNTQDDLAAIQQHAPVAPDDHGNTTGSATTLPNPAGASGQIAVGDVDVFSVTVGSGPLAATLTPTGNNLHAVVTIRNSLGQTVASGSPVQALSWTATAATTATAGTYTITVAPSGWLTATNGFTSYASLGGYALTVNGTGGTTTPTTTTVPGTPATDPPTNPTTNSPTGNPPPGTDAGSTLVATTPLRLADTRTGLGGSLRLGAGTQMSIQVAGVNGVPTTATAAVLNITAVGPGAAGYLSVFPCATGPTGTSVVNYAPGETIANTTIATLDAGGRVCVSTLTASDVLVDITGWLAPAAGSRLTTIGPVRVADTRTGLGGTGRLSAGGTLQIDLRPWTGASATAVALNVTVVGASAPGYVTAYPCGSGVPTTSTVNHRASETRPNNTIVGLGDGTVCIFSLADADVLVDLVGAFGATGLAYVPAAPTRLVDTRDLGGPLVRATGVEYDLDAAAGTARAAFVNVTAVGHSLDGFTSTYGCAQLPDTSTLNQLAGQVAANGAIVAATASGTSCAWVLNGGHLAIDLGGWWVP